MSINFLAKDNLYKDTSYLKMLDTIITLGIFGITLLLILLRPKGLNEAIIALGGGVLMLGLGRVSFAQVISLFEAKWEVYFFFLGLMTIAAIADSAGFFDWTAAVAVKLADGKGHRLFLNVFLLGTLITTFLSNDATALILTPVVYTLVTRLRLNPLPFMFACTFIADTASMTLLVSNPINILITGSFPHTQDLGSYWKHLLIPSLLACIINVTLFYFLFRKEIPATFQLHPEAEAAESEKEEVWKNRNPAFFRFTVGCLGLIALCYILASLFKISVAFVALGGAGVLLAGAFYYKKLNLPTLGKEISWSIFVFISGMFVVVKAVENTGLTGQLGSWLTSLGGSNLLVTVLVFTFGTALGTNLINNVPMALVMVSTIEQILNQQPHLTAQFQNGLIYSSIIGADLGPNLTTVGSLATVLWLLILRRKGLEISSMRYFRVGIVVTPLMLLVTALVLWLSLLF